MELDFHALVDGVVRNNVGVDGIELTVRARIEEGTVILSPSGQRLPLAKSSMQPSGDGEAQRRFVVQGYLPGEQVTLGLLAPRPIDADSH